MQYHTIDFHVQVEENMSCHYVKASPIIHNYWTDIKGCSSASSLIVESESSSSISNLHSFKLESNQFSQQTL